MAAPVAGPVACFLARLPRQRDCNGSSPAPPLLQPANDHGVNLSSTLRFDARGVFHRWELTNPYKLNFLKSQHRLHHLSFAAPQKQLSSVRDASLTVCRGHFPKGMSIHDRPLLQVCLTTHAAPSLYQDLVARRRWSCRGLLPLESRRRSFIEGMRLGT